MGQPITIGLDLAKKVFQVHGVDVRDKVVRRRQLRRTQLLLFFSQLKRCLVGMEACAGAHHWGREIAALGHEVRLMPPAYVTPYVKRGKTDAVDAQAVCEAVTRPTMRFAPVKTAQTQSALQDHKTRDFLVRQRTQIINAIRAHMGELGIVVAKGIQNVERLIVAAEAVLEAARAALDMLAEQLKGTQDPIDAVTGSPSRRSRLPKGQAPGR